MFATAMDYNEFSSSPINDYAKNIINSYKEGLSNSNKRMIDFNINNRFDKMMKEINEKMSNIVEKKDERPATYEDLIKLIEDYHSTSTTEKNIQKEIAEKRDLVTKMRTIFKVQRPLVKKIYESPTNDYSAPLFLISASRSDDFINRLKTHMTDDEIHTIVNWYVNLMETVYKKTENKTEIYNKIKTHMDNLLQIIEKDIDMTETVLYDEKYMTETEKLIAGLEKEIDGLFKTMTNMKNNSESIKLKLIENQKSIYKYTIDHIKLYFNYHKIRDGTSYNEKTLIENIKKVLDTPTDAILNSFIQPAVDATDVGFSVDNYASYDNSDPINPTVQMPVNSRVKNISNDIRDISKKNPDTQGFSLKTVFE